MIPKPKLMPYLLSLWCLAIGLYLLVRIYQPMNALSLLWGVSVCLAPSTIFAWFVFRFQGASFAREMVNGFYRGEALKFILTVVLFAWVFHQVERISPAVFFLSFVATQFITWLLGVLAVNRRLK